MPPSEFPPTCRAGCTWWPQSVTDPANPRFAKSIVNRLWKRYLGLGLFEPADDFRLDSPASHPELLDWLAHDFVEHGCDLKHTIRLILTSRTYQLALRSAAGRPFRRSGQKNAPRYFRSPALRRLTAEQLLDSMRVATSGQFVPAERCVSRHSLDGPDARAGPAGLAQRDQHRPARRRGDRAGARAAQRPELHELIYPNAAVHRSRCRSRIRDGWSIGSIGPCSAGRPACREKRRRRRFCRSAEIAGRGLEGHVLGAGVQSRVSIHQVGSDATDEPDRSSSIRRSSRRPAPARLSRLRCSVRCALRGWPTNRAETLRGQGRLGDLHLAARRHRADRHLGSEDATRPSTPGMKGSELLGTCPSIPTSVDGLRFGEGLGEDGLGDAPRHACCAA